MDALDGNALAGPLLEFFGLEMTSADGRCRHCGAITVIGELHVYLHAPGSVARCPDCGSAVIVIVIREGEARIDLAGFDLLDPEGGPLPLPSAVPPT